MESREVDYEESCLTGCCVILMKCPCQNGMYKVNEVTPGRLDQYASIADAVTGGVEGGHPFLNSDTGALCFVPCPTDTTVTCSENVYTLFSKLSSPHPQTADYPGLVTIGELGAGSTHPVRGYSINGRRVFSVCSEEIPPNDGNNHERVLGTPSSFIATLTYDSTPLEDPVCC